MSAFPYGYHAVAPDETYCIILSPNANAEERVHMPMSMLERPSGGAPGDVFVFHPLTGSSIKFDAEGNITINAVAKVTVVSPTKIEETAPEIELTGNTLVTGTLDVTGIATVDTDIVIGGAIDHNGSTAGFYGIAPIVRPIITGAHGTNAAFLSLLAGLDLLGIIDDQST